MPIYEYRCDQCGDIFEEWQKFSDPVIDKCPSCGGHASRLISQSTFILKGSGWYVTDYAGKNSTSSSSSCSSKDSSKNSSDDS